ncbi:Rrf2 family transcriptional regulator [Peribacillus psychrosaccharolyticus]|uniref:HTH-type transcriptional regulator NsrR n=1 Tax=Peribacillus psychrosaccharolyticus TaxID=1407 RepID=A0A974NQ39_PERPY|nr:Rrf2 family transcriptional regulator [Peribacillus psychrosaccharolyticus]MEC2057716.1 Rrf2 family transcriptional regulator [Peribacillus psychrosaccharolyticus]MED3746406.1 Rrf2 family transcriptional regulator [Peribacillus psychrosaccharolyticus]QQT01922.1 Rrf2 family transcriptional regulator [Peribacillus psychrosaccharolyticus]
MRLTSYSDFSLRVLLYVAVNSEKLVTIKEISEAYEISSNHLMKIIYNLGKMNYIETIRGRNGGIRLSRQPADINIGELIRKTEEDFYLVECFKEDNNCVITPVCSLKHMLNEALNSFFLVLDKYTLEDILTNKSVLKEYFDTRTET